VDCDNGHFLHPDGDALSLDGAVVGRSLRLGYDGTTTTDESAQLPAGFFARGAVRLWDTQINQDILATGGEFETPQGAALLASNLRVAGRVVLVCAKVQGTVNLFSAQIEHDLDLKGSHFDARQTFDHIALLAIRWFRPNIQLPGGRLNIGAVCHNWHALGLIRCAAKPAGRRCPRRQ
jgi:hypothetical protein